jgi:NAD(P)-dependent dehydrogenase (short-subunit alcohol dehydrogenase family)
MKTVRYIGKKPEWKDRLYESGLVFTTGQARTVPEGIARRFLRHGDLFVPMVDTDGMTDVIPAEPAVDDTAELLEEARAKAAEKNRKEMDLADLHRAVDQMDFDTLAEFSARYGRKTDRRRSLERNREAAHQLIDRFGAI